MIPVIVRLGIGMWSVYHEVKLIACPVPKGLIIVDEEVLSCDQVIISSEGVDVHSKKRFTSVEDLQPYLDKGWTKEYPG